jgi:hypothetical protein
MRLGIEMPVDNFLKKILLCEKTPVAFDLMNNKPSVIRFLLTSDSFHWAVSDSVEGAAEKLISIGAKRTSKVFGTMVANDESPCVSAEGALCYGGKEAPDAWLVHLGLIGTIGGLIRKDR